MKRAIAITALIATLILAGAAQCEKNPCPTKQKGGGAEPRTTPSCTIKK